MFNFMGQADDRCDCIARRSFLKVGFLGLGGLSLSNMLRWRATADVTTKKQTSVIFVELAGGPSHFETYDPKPEAPSEYRGPLASIPTAISGVRFSELMTEQARIADRLAIIRSVQHTSSAHETSSHLVQTGYYLRDRQNRENEMPCAGAVTARVCGARKSGVPAYVAIPRIMRSGSAAYLGGGFDPFVTGGDPSNPNFQVNNLDLTKNLSRKRLKSRKALLASLDHSRRVLDNRGMTDALDQFTVQAFEMVTGKQARHAFDLAAEEPRLRDRYGRSRAGQGMLLARRLVEAGVTFVTVQVPGWDDHAQIAKRMRDRVPEYDRAIAMLVEDLAERGLSDDVLVVAMGEFGRTPRINRNAGRDHWGSVMSVLLAGGGLKMGQVIGSSNRRGEIPASQPYHPNHVLATVYRHLGIDTSQLFEDLSGRPRYVLEQRDIIKELI